MRTAFNAAAWLVDRHVDEGRGDRTAVRGLDRTLTYTELAALTRKVAAALRAIGVRRDDRVVFVMADDVELLSGILGAFRAGVVAVPVSTMLQPHELGPILADSGARIVCATPEFAGVVREALTLAPDVEHLVVTGPADPGAVVPAGVRTHTWDELLALGATSDTAVADTDEDAWALWLYTSGTTGSPKGAMHRHANIRHVCETYGTQVLGITANDVVLSVAKLFFAYGLGNSALFPLAVGATTVLEPRRPSADVVAERMARERPTLFCAVPTFFAHLVASDLPDDTFASVRLATSAGEPLPAPLQRRFTARFGVDIIDGIGSTEALHIFLSNRPDDIRPGTTGVAVPGYDLELRGTDGLLVAPGQPGTLFVRGQSNALGYWRNTSATRQVFVGEWLNTGDTYAIDADGYYVCLGRSNDLIKAGGIWVTPSEVESRLLEHPLVAEAAVVGFPDAEGLDKPVACVVTTAPVSPDELIAWCRDGLAHFKSPRSIVFVGDLPKTATGKLQRFKVRQLVAEQVRP